MLINRFKKNPEFMLKYIFSPAYINIFPLNFSEFYQRKKAVFNQLKMKLKKIYKQNKSKLNTIIM